MGLFKKVKDILFDEEEEEYTNQIKITPDMRNDEKEEKASVKTNIDTETTIPFEEKKPVKVEKKVEPEETGDKDIYKTDSTFPFFDFDDEEFNSQKNIASQNAAKKVEEKKPEPRNLNVFEYEKRKRSEKRTDYGRYEKTEITESYERKKFKPSPIISPVYGILNQDYQKDDIVKREDVDNLDIESVRKKAFGEKKVEEKIEKVFDPKPKTTYYDEEETVSITIPEEKKRKVKTIDELLEDTSDIVVDIDRDLDVEFDDLVKNENDKLEDTIKIESKVEDDTLENDLFDLIDSMYDSDEDGE